jgi:hypothetical protein
MPIVADALGEDVVSVCNRARVYLPDVLTVRTRSRRTGGPLWPTTPPPPAAAGAALCRRAGRRAVCVPRRRACSVTLHLPYI